MSPSRPAPVRNTRPESVSSPVVLAFAALLAVTALARRSVPPRPRGAAGSRAGAAREADSRARSRKDEGSAWDKGNEPTSPEEAARLRSQPDRGRDATSPREIPKAGWKDILWRTYEEFNEDRLMLVAAGVTFYVLLALVPTIAAFISLYGLFFDPQDVQGHVLAMADVLPGGAVEIIGGQVERLAQQDQGALGFAFAFGLVIALWSANAGVKAIFDALNVVYEEREKRSFVMLNLQALAFTLGGIAVIIVLLAAIAVVPAILAFANLGDTAQWAISILRWPIALVFIMTALALLYRYGPSRKKAQWRWVTWGSAFAGIGWLVFSMLFSWYVANFGTYDATYGSLGAIIGFMTWLWLSMTILLVGGELNAEIEHQTAHDSTGEPHAPLGERGAAMADSLGKTKD